MHSTQDSETVAIILCTSFATLIGGFVLGVWSTQGYLISPSLKEERRKFYKDPVESDESDVDEDDTLLDHAPNWANGADADRRQGLSAGAVPKRPIDLASNEECKLVLVVRTDLGMTKGKNHHRHPIQPERLLTKGDNQAKSQHSAPTQHWRASRPFRAPTLPRPRARFSPAGSATARPRLPCRSSRRRN